MFGEGTANVLLVSAPVTCVDPESRYSSNDAVAEKLTVGIEDAQRDRMRLPIIKHRREGRQVNAIRPEIQRLDAGNRNPQKRINTARVNPRIHRATPAGFPSDGHSDSRNAVPGQLSSLPATSFGTHVYQNSSADWLCEKNVKIKIGNVRRKRQSLFQQARVL